MDVTYGPGSLGVPFSRARRSLKAPLAAKGPKGWEQTILHMKQQGIKNPWALSWWMRDHGMHPHQHAAHLAVALAAAAATETRSYQDLVRAAGTGDPVARLQVAAACQLLALLTQ